MSVISKNCTGCMACVNACPKKCIDVIDNYEGFKEPVIRTDECISCGKCDSVCIANHPSPGRQPNNIFIAQSKNCELVLNSSSGGLFSELAQYIINNGGVVYGAAIDYENSYEVRHKRVDSKADMHILMRSKYVQSKIGSAYTDVKKDLNSGKQVLFSGTPCQVAALNKFLGRSYDNLITIDFICHGVPSPGVWSKYIQEFGENKITKINFRDKRNGWTEYGISLTLRKSDEVEYNYYNNKNEDVFIKGFTSNLYLRPSCHKCPSKNFSSGSDITLGDAWGMVNDFRCNEDLKKLGLSLLIVNSEKGEILIDNIKNNVVLEKTNISKLNICNPIAFTSCKPHRKRKKFFKMLERGFSVGESVCKCLPPPTYLDKIIWSIKRRLVNNG